MVRLGVVTGLRFEAAAVKEAATDYPSLHLSIETTGADPRRAAEGAERLVRGGAQILASFGLAGGLDAALRPGAVLVADAVSSPDGTRFEADARWLGRAPAGAVRSVRGGVAGSDVPVMTPDAKAALRAATGAAAVDMESHAAAAAAARAGLPLLVVRVIVDPAGRAVPEAAVAAMDESGAVRPGRLIAALGRSPGQTIAIARLAVDTARARARLRRAAALLAVGALALS